MNQLVYKHGWGKINIQMGSAASLFPPVLFRHLHSQALKTHTKNICYSLKPLSAYLPGAQIQFPCNCKLYYCVNNFPSNSTEVPKKTWKENQKLKRQRDLLIYTVKQLWGLDPGCLFTFFCNIIHTIFFLSNVKMPSQNK